MGEVPLPLHVDAALKEKLEAEARLQNVSADDIAARAIGRYLELHARERTLLKERVEEADKGVFISEQAMTRWIKSWGSDEELPPPEPDIFPAGNV